MNADNNSEIQIQHTKIVDFLVEKHKFQRNQHLYLQRLEQGER